MGYEERNAWVGLVVGIATMLAYVALLVTAADGGPVSEVDYQPLMIGTIAVAIAVVIVATIGVNIVSGIVTGDREFRRDQRDKEISRFGELVGRAFLVIGALAALLMAMAEWEYFWIANALFAGFAISAAAEGIAKVIAYRRGLPQW